ncbi:MAG: hypothetical protein J6332_06260 [Abditibacteriota bacterium]|nr:hypothetical protein [Abditibacteriota bacterium]
MKTKAVLLIILLFFALGSCNGESLRIIYTNDIEGRFFPCDCGGAGSAGFARTAGVIAKLRREKPNSIVVDSGGFIDKSYKASLASDLAKTAGYDVMSRSGKAVFNTAAVKTVESGAVYLKSAAFVSAGSEGDLRKGKPVLIALDREGKLTDAYLKSAKNGPDILIGGRSRSAIKGVKKAGRTRILQTSVGGTKVGCCDIVIEKGKIKSVAVKTVAVTASSPESGAVKAKLTAFEKKCAAVAEANPKTLVFGNLKKGASKTVACKIKGKNYKVIGMRDSDSVRIVSVKGGVVTLKVTGREKGRLKEEVLLDISSPGCAFELKITVAGNVK